MAQFVSNPYPDIGNLYAVRQEQMRDIPRRLFDVNEAVAQFPDMVDARLERARAMAPALIVGNKLIPVTPLRNPETGYSHHTVRLWSSEQPTKIVDLLFNDTTTLYLTGFRRGVVTAILEDDVKLKDWGTWFVFDDLMNDAPAFLNAVKMGITSEHQGGTVGGPQALLQMFYSLYRFEDRVQFDEHGQVTLTWQLQTDLQRAVSRAILTFSETLRLRSVYAEVLGRLESGLPATDLSREIWHRINSWGVFCGTVLGRRRLGRMDLHQQLPEDYRTLYRYPTATLGDLIGPDGDLSLCKCVDQQMLITDNRIKNYRRTRRNATRVKDPRFKEEEAQSDG